MIGVGTRGRGRPPVQGWVPSVYQLGERWVAQVRTAFNRRTSLGMHPTREAAFGVALHYLATGERPAPEKRGPKAGSHHRAPRKTAARLSSPRPRAPRTATARPAPVPVPSTRSAVPADRLALMRAAWARTGGTH